MNCKPGDLAVVVRSAAGNEGKIVRCIRLLPAHTQLRRDGSLVTRPCWETDTPLRGWNGGLSSAIADEKLRPIRDPGDDARDETLDWLPAPGAKETA